MNGVAGPSTLSASTRWSLHTAGGHALVAGNNSMQKLLDWATHALTVVGVPTPRVDAEWLLAHVLGVRRDRLWTDGTMDVAPSIAEQFSAFVARRLTRAPLQYILGTQEFYGRSFRVTPEVLIPRPETELLVEKAVNLVRSSRCTVRGSNTEHQTLHNEQRIHILEIGTGSGCIAITLALECPTAQIIATDISPAALAVARMNATTHSVANRIEFMLQDFFAPRVTCHVSPQYDLLISNPPYCPEPQWATLQPEVRDFEPRHALVAGKDGLDFLHRIIQDVPPRLKPGGWLLLEIGDGQAQAIRSLLKTSQAFAAVTFRRDYNDVERIGIAQRQ